MKCISILIRAFPFFLSSSEKLLPHLSFKSSMGWSVLLDSFVDLVFELPRRSWIRQFQKKIICDFQKHKKYTEIIDENRLKMDSLQSRFSWIFLMKTSPDLSCIWKPLKWAFQNWSYMPKKTIFQGSYGLLKFVHEKRKFELFLNENTKISFSIGKF